MGVFLGKNGRDDKNYLKILTHNIFPILHSTPWYKIKLTAVTKGRGPGIFPGYYKSEPRLL